MTQRTASAQRTTSESDVSVSIDLDGTGASTIDTGVPFYDHMLTALSKHSLIDMEIRAQGDVHIDVHHTVEDTAITLGWALEGRTRRQGAGSVDTVTRWSRSTKRLAQAVVDISGRPYFVHEGESDAQRYHLIGGHFTGSMTGHALESLAFQAGLTVHLRLLAGRDAHHIAEAQFKAFAPSAPHSGRTGSPGARCSVDEGGSVSRTVIVTPFGRPDQLAAACVLSEIPGDVVPIGDFSAIVQSGTDIEAGNRAAAAISKLTGKHEVLLMVRSEEQIDAAHYRGGDSRGGRSGRARAVEPSERARTAPPRSDRSS